MKCLHPRRVPNSHGLMVDCGKCLSCRINRTREWTLRLTNEANNSLSCFFITLTYNEEHLPSDGSVSKRDVQDFISNLRTVAGSGIRYFIGSEYGQDETATRRPHYHGLIFNVPRDLIFIPCSGSDRVETRRGKSGHISYINTYLNDIWRRGFVTVGEFVPQRAGYLAGYYVNKVDAPKGHAANFSLMSRRPGIGHDFAVSSVARYCEYGYTYAHTGRRVAIPRYYRGICNDMSDRFVFDVNDQELIQQINDEKQQNKILASQREEVMKKHLSFHGIYKKQI